MTALTDRVQIEAPEWEQMKRKNRFLTITVVVLAVALVGLGAWNVYEQWISRTDEVSWGITLDEAFWGPGVHTVFMIAEFRPLTVDQVEDLSGKLIWDETVVDLCNISIRDIGGDYLHIGDIFQTIEGCGSNPTAMQDAFDEFGLPETACVAVRSSGVDHEYCAPLG